MSRTIMDIVLPLLCRQQLQLQHVHDLHALHQLMESVSAIVYRPLDILLTALLSPPAPAADVLTDMAALSKWFAVLLLLLRVLMMEAREEVVLTRFAELKKTSSMIGSHGLLWFIDTIAGAAAAAAGAGGQSSSVDSATDPMNSDVVLAEFLLQAFDVCVR